MGVRLASFCLDVALSLAPVRTNETTHVFIVGSTGLGGSCSASESAASLDPCTVSPEVTEQRKQPQEVRGPEGSPLPRPSLPRELVFPSASMPFTECPPEGCLASSEAAPEDGILTHQLRTEPSRNVPGDTLVTFAPEGDASTHNSTAARTPSAEGDNTLKEEAQSLSSSCTGQLPAISLVPLQEPRTELLCGEGDWPGGFEFQRKEAMDGCSPPESATQAPAAIWLGMESSAVLEECLPKLETTAPENPVLRSSDRERGGVEVLPMNSKNLEFLKGCHPSKSSSGANPGARTSTASQQSRQQNVEMHLPRAELPSDPLGPATAPGDSGFWKEALDSREAQSQPQAGTTETEPQQVVGAVAASQLDGSLLLRAELPPFTGTEKTSTASSPHAHPAAWNSVASEDPSLAKETVSEAQMLVSADLTTEQVGTGLVELKAAPDLRRTGEQPEGSLQGVPVPFLQGQNNTALEGLLLPTFSHGVSNESSRRSVEPTDGPEAPKNTENRVVPGEESQSLQDNPKAQQKATKAVDGTESGNHEEERSQAVGCKLHPESDKDEVSKPHSTPETSVIPSSGSAQPPSQEVAGRMDGLHTGSGEAVQPVIAECHVPDTATSLHKLHKEDPILSSASDGTGEHFPLQEAIWESSALQTRSPIMLQGRGGLGTTEPLPALGSEKSGFLSAAAVKEVPKAGEAENILEVKKSHLPLQQPYSCDGEGLLISPGQPCDLEKVEPGQEVHADVSPPRDERNSTTGHGLTMFGLEQDCQGKLSCPEDSLPQPFKNSLQPCQLDPETSLFAILHEKDQPPTNGQGACPSGPTLEKQGTDPSTIPVPEDGKPEVDVSLPHNGKERASGPPPTDRPHNIPSSSPKDTVLGGVPSEESELSAPLGQELPALGENEQGDTGSGSQPSETLPPAADASLAGNLGGKDSCCIGQGLNKSQQELADALKTGNQHEEARCRDLGISEAGDVLPLPQGFTKTEMASRNKAEAPPCPPDSVALLDTAHCSPDPVPTSPRVTPTQDALASEACDESQKDSAPQLEMEQLATSGAKAQRLLGGFLRAEEEEQDGKGPSAEVNVDASDREPGAQQASEGTEAAQKSGCFQTEQSLPSTLAEPCQLAQLEPSCRDALLPAGDSEGLPRSTVGIPAHGTVAGPQRLVSAELPKEIVPDTSYLQINGAARQEVEDDSLRAVSSEDPRAPHESPCPVKELPPALKNHTSGQVSPVSFTTLLQPGTAGEEIFAAGAGSGSPQAGTMEEPVSFMPYLDRRPLLAKDEQMTREMCVAAAPEANARPSETTAGESGGNREKAEEPPGLRVGTSGHESASSKQTSITTGLPDFREHISKIFEQSVLGALAADRPQRIPGKKAGAPRNVPAEGPDMSLNPGKLLDGSPKVAAVPLPVLSVGLQAEKKQESDAEAEVSHLVPQDPAPEKLVGLVETALEENLPHASAEGEVPCVPLTVTSERLEGTVEPGQGAQAHSQQGRSSQESASSLPSSAAAQGMVTESAPGFPVAPQSPADKTSAQGDRSPSATEPLETLASNSEHKDDACDPAHTQGPSNLPGSTCALEGSSRGSVLNVPDSNSEPWIPATLGGERQIEAAVSAAEMQNVLGYQGAPKPLAGEVLETPPEPSKMAGAPEEAGGDVTPGTAEVWTCVSGDLPETGTTRMLPCVAGDSPLPGYCQDSGCSNRAQAMEDTATLQGDSPVGCQQAKQQLESQLLDPSGYGKNVPSPSEPDDSKDTKKLHLLAPAERHSDRYLGAMSMGSDPL